ncbi:MAG: hypothetical protein ACT6RD_12815 [Brevundimonas sp.]|uniref:hypothetical protein n=1 Tax=Brevundimonas sp. TaxID=1871086 RepID=UPI004033E762
MQRIDGAYLYEVGAALRKITDLEERDYSAIDLWVALSAPRQEIGQFLHASVFSGSLKTVRQSGDKLLNELSALIVEPGPSTDWSEVFPEWKISSLKRAFATFEAILKAELQTFALYHVASKGGLDTQCLTDQGQELFPASLQLKVPEAVGDAVVGARCLAFGLWTAMGFHFHRANEAVLRRYYASVIGAAKQPKHLTLGTMTSSMKQNGVGDTNIIAALDNIREFHRNPIAHPDHSLGSDEEALSLYASIRAAVGYMLDKLPPAAPLTAPPVVLPLAP